METQLASRSVPDPGRLAGVGMRALSEKSPAHWGLPGGSVEAPRPRYALVLLPH